MNGENFWGLPVPVSNSPVTFDLEGKCLHVTQVALKGEGSVRLEVSTAILRKQRLVLATLSETHPQAVLDATFFETDKKVTFHAKGNKGDSIHLTGVVVASRETGPNQSDDESDSDYGPSDAQSLEENDRDHTEMQDEQAKDQSNRKKRKHEVDDDPLSMSGDEEEDEEVVSPVSKKKKKKKKRKKEKQDAPNGTAGDDETNFHERRSGLKVAVTKQGRGSKATPGEKISIIYRGYLVENGNMFDSSDGQEPLKFRVGHGVCIKGMDEGALGMKVGEERILVMPPNLAYGPKGIPGVIPPHSTLRFEVSRVE